MPLSEEDVGPILKLYNSYIQETTVTFHTEMLDREKMRSALTSSNSRYGTFCIRKESEFCGYIQIHRYRERQAYDDSGEVTLYLAPAYQGKGLGSLALRFIEEFARGQKFHVLLAVITGENQSSIRLFEKNGYEKCAHFKEVGRKFGRYLDVVAYQKIL